MKKKSIILTVLTALVIILTMYIVSEATDFKVGEKINLGMAYPGDKITQAINIINEDGYNYFCAHQGVAFVNNSKEYGKAIKFSNIAKVEIKGDTATVTAGTTYGKTETKTFTYNENNTYANREVALLFNKIKDGSAVVNKLNFAYEATKQNNGSWKVVIPDGRVGYTVTNEKITLTRMRNSSNGINYGLRYDFGQSAMWRVMLDWKNNVAKFIDTNKESLWSAISNALQDSNLPKELSGSKKIIAEDVYRAWAYGLELYNEVYDEARKAVVNNQYGIEEDQYKVENKEIRDTICSPHTYTILGPFKYNFTGTIKDGKPTLTFDSSTTSQPYTIGTYFGDTFTEINKIVSGSQFYIKVETSSLSNVSNIHFTFEVEGISLYNTTTTLCFYERSNNFNKFQPIVYLEQTTSGHTPFKDSYKISKPVDVSLEKLDVSGEPLKAEGIKFQIKDNTNTVVAYFKTDSNGKGIITDANWNATGETTVTLAENQTYTLIENENSLYGYKKGYLIANNIEISGATIEQDKEDVNNIKFTLNSDCADRVTIKAKNAKELATLEIEKAGEDSTKLGKVAFLIKIDSNKYLQLKNNDNRIVATIEGTATINSENKANSSEYHVEYVDNKNEATQFITDSTGKIVINNLEVNKNKTAKYTYTACEVYNLNYGYGSATNASLTKNIQLTLNQENKIEINNTQALGNLELKKYDQDNHNVILPNVGFAIEISSNVANKYAYLALYDQNGELVQSIKDTATINNQNKANNAEYRVEYYNTDKPYQELTDTEKANITIFVTGDDAIITVNNLEVYCAETTQEYTYKFIEVFNENYGYVESYQETEHLKLEANKTTNLEFTNSLIYTKISGYVWIDKLDGKANEYDNVYTNGIDQKLVDLYILENGQLVKNSEAKIPVEIKLRNNKTGEIIKALPDEFDETGKYTFIDVFVAEFENYEVVFEYDGFYYTTVATNLDADNGSKVKEVSSERETLNNKFSSVEDGAQVISTDGTINPLEYDKDGHTSTLSELKFDTTISANTHIAGFDLVKRYSTIKENSNATIETLQDVNMGIVLREQPKISINSDIYSALIEFEGYKYNYKYNGRQNYYENKNDDDIGVKFEQEYTAQRYTRTVYASDIQAAADFDKEIKLSITYKIQVANQSKTLAVLPKQIINYFDSRYEIEAIGLCLDETTHTVTNTLSYSTPQVVQELPRYKSTVITFNELIETEQNVKDLFITFSVNRDAILDLLNQKSTYHNASEILSYASYYGKDTIEAGDTGNRVNTLYAGIDKISQPGNMELKLVDHPVAEGTQILDTTNFEDDSTSAPSLILEATEARKVSGTIWEDVATNTSDNQKLGDGIFNEGEKVIQGVKVELHKINEDGTVGDIATYSNGNPVSTISDENGNYTFGYYDEQAKKHVGILPGKYVVEYTYNNESYIVGNKNINLDDYKSTIITSEIVKNAFEQNNNQRWYIINEANRYSDARDNLSLRKEYGNTDSNFTVTNSTYNSIIALENMNSYTPIMDIGIEFTQLDEADALTLELVKECKNIDFGIVERPNVEITIEKEITGLEIVAQNGTSIIPYGDPTDINTRMQYVKSLDGLVSVEVETDLLQGAELNLEYTITLVNNSDKDYLESEYYYYGTGGKTEITTKAKQVVDYMSSTMTVNLEKAQGIWEETTAEALYNEGEGLVSEETYKLLKTGNYNILTTKAFEEVGSGSDKSVKLYATKYLAVSDLTREENKVEVIELAGIRTIEDSIPGNYIPTESSSEPDTDRIDLVITPPTGGAVNYIIYIIATIATFAILVSGIVIIKKKLIK